MPASSDDQGFYEDDEPLDKIEAAFHRGPHGLTMPAMAAAGQAAWIPGLALANSGTGPAAKIRLVPAALLDRERATVNS